VANPDDANDISIKISEIISKRKTYSRMPKNEIIKYSREYLTSLLNSTLNLYDEKD
jgi:hypothetical protein